MLIVGKVMPLRNTLHSLRVTVRRVATGTLGLNATERSDRGRPHKLALPVENKNWPFLAGFCLRPALAASVPEAGYLLVATYARRPLGVCSLQLRASTRVGRPLLVRLGRRKSRSGGTHA